MSAPAHRTRIKFCGMTRAGDIAEALALGVDAIGLVLVERSPRCLTPDAARTLREALPPQVSAIVLTMDAEADAVRRIIDVVRPDALQFHGSESDAECARHGLRYLKALPMADAEPLAAMIARYPGAGGFVLDAHASGEAGGSGRCFDWHRIDACIDRPWLLAGGLGPDNVFDAICALRPYAVDVSSGIEQTPGQKCPHRMAEFVAEVQRADAVLNSEER